MFHVKHLFFARYGVEVRRGLARLFVTVRHARSNFVCRGVSPVMRTSLSRLSFAVMLAVLALLPLHAPSQGHAAPDAGTYDFTAVTTLIQGAVTNVPLAGASLRVVKDGQVVYEQTFGGLQHNYPRADRVGHEVVLSRGHHVACR